MPGGADRSVPLLLVGLLLVELCLVALYAVNAWFGSASRLVDALFDLDAEASIPTWFSSAQLLLTAALFAAGGWRAGKTPPARWFLWLAAVAFMFLSTDEAASIHEKVTVAFRGLDWVPRLKGDHGVWIAPYLLAILIGLLACRRQLAGLWRRHTRAAIVMAAGAGVLMIGAVGFETLSYQFLRNGASPSLYRLEVAAEEFLEMAGASIILAGAVLLNRGGAEPRVDS
jgi:hypothetical protein